MQRGFQERVGGLAVGFKNDTPSFPSEGWSLDGFGCVILLHRDDQLGKSSQLEHLEDALDRFRDAERPLDRVELFVVGHQDPDAGGADVIDPRKIQDDVVLTGTDGRVDDAADMIRPVGIEASVEAQFQMLIVGVLRDLHRRLV